METLALAAARQYDYSRAKPVGPAKRAAKARAAEIVGERDGAVVLDVGGESYYSEAFTARGISLVQLNRPDDMHAMSYAAEFDGALAMHVLEHSPFPLLVLRLIRRALVPGGFFYVAVPHVTRKWIKHPAHFSVLDPRAWKRLLYDADFKVTHQESGPFGPKSTEERFLCE